MTLFRFRIGTTNMIKIPTTVEKSRYIVRLILFLLLMAIPAIESKAQSPQKSAIKIDISINGDAQRVCRDAGLNLRVQLTNDLDRRVAFHPSALWSRLRFFEDSKHGEGGRIRTRVRSEIGESLPTEDTSKIMILAPGQSVEFEKTLALTAKFFETSRRYSLQLRYFDSSFQKPIDSMLFLDDADSNEATFRLVNCQKEKRPSTR